MTTSTNNARLAARIPNCTIEIMPHTGHAVHLEQPDLFLDMVERFIRAN